MSISLPSTYKSRDIQFITMEELTPISTIEWIGASHVCYQRYKKGLCALWPELQPFLTRLWEGYIRGHCGMG